MFRDLLVDLGQAFSAASEAGGSGAKDGTPPAPADGGYGGGAERHRAPVFHVTEYDVIQGRYPQSWKDHAGAYWRCPQHRRTRTALSLYCVTRFDAEQANSGGGG